jgi:hypothetical protein
MIRLEVTEQAKKFNSRQYPLRLSAEEKQALKDAGLVVIHPHSDDCAEIEGAITDEASVWEGGEFLLSKDGVVDCTFHGLEQYVVNCAKRLIEHLERDELLSHLENYCKSARSAIKVNALWAQGSRDWWYELSIPHATFDLMERDRVMAECVVFHVDDMGGSDDQ